MNRSTITTCVPSSCLGTLIAEFEKQQKIWDKTFPEGPYKNSFCRGSYRDGKDYRDDGSIVCRAPGDPRGYEPDPKGEDISLWSDKKRKAVKAKRQAAYEKALRESKIESDRRGAIRESARAKLTEEEYDELVSTYY